MKTITRLPIKFMYAPAKLVIEKINVFNHKNDLVNFPMCVGDMEKDSDMYILNSDWYASYMYTSDGMKHLVALTCVNHLHPEFSDSGDNLHLSAIEVDPKFRDSVLETPLHVFSLTMRAIMAQAKKAGYSRMSLQAKDTDKIPKYEHLGFSILDLSNYDSYKDNLDFYKDHPIMILDL